MGLLSPQVPGCFAMGRCGVSLPAALQEPCLELLARPVTSAGISAGLISVTTIRQRPYMGSERGTSLDGGHKGRGTKSCFSRGIRSLTRQLSSQIPSCSPAPPAPLTPTAGAMGRQLELSCTQNQSWHVPAPLLPVSAHGWGRQLCAQPFCSGDVAPGTQRADAAFSSSSYPEHLTVAANPGRWAHVRLWQPGLSTFSWVSLLLAGWWRRFFPVRPPLSSHLPTCPCALALALPAAPGCPACTAQPSPACRGVLPPCRAGSQALGRRGGLER